MEWLENGATNCCSRCLGHIHSHAHTKAFSLPLKGREGDHVVQEWEERK